jgi:hypothetical protein
MCNDISEEVLIWKKRRKRGRRERGGYVCSNS